MELMGTKLWTVVKKGTSNCCFVNKYKDFSKIIHLFFFKRVVFPSLSFQKLVFKLTEMTLK